MKSQKLGACVATLSLLAMPVAQARVSASCATAAEISAIQVSAVIQELGDATLSCGPAAGEKMARFLVIYRKEMNRSDIVLKSMFKRLNGARGGDAAYDAYKTRAINHAEQRRIKPGEQENFCKTADLVFAAALAPDKPVLEDFVSGIPVNEDNPVNSCEIKVAVSLQGVQAGPDIVPTPRPARPGDPSLFPN